MAPSRGAATVLGIVAGSVCTVLLAPLDLVVLSSTPRAEAELWLPPMGSSLPILASQPIAAEGWALLNWQECPLTAKGHCKICLGSAAEILQVEAKLGYQKSPVQAVPSCQVLPAATTQLPSVEPARALSTTPNATERTTKPAKYVLNAGKDGLPIIARPAWLIKEDELIIDARKEQFGGILILQPVLMDATGGWGQLKASRPRWLRAILATNRNHARLHGHCVILRWQPTQPQLTKWQRRQCGKMDEKTCTRNNERENFNWEKHLMLYEYLLSPQNFSHVLMLDADAALVKHSLNILREIAGQMERRNLDVFLTSEDWLLNGENRINGGFLMTRNSEWSRHLFHDTFRAHVLGPGGLRRWKIGLPHQECSSNEQICLNDIMSGSNKELVKGHMSLESGIIYNRGGCTVKHCGEPITDPKMEVLGMKDDRLQVLHFMGGSKPLAPMVLCDGKDYTGDGPKGYGCHK